MLCFSSIYMLPNLTTSSIQVPTCLWEMLVFHPYMLPNLSSRLVGSRKFLHYRKAKASTKMLPNRIWNGLVVVWNGLILGFG
jgi:hypothetical protein